MHLKMRTNWGINKRHWGIILVLSFTKWNGASAKCWNDSSLQDFQQLNLGTNGGELSPDLLLTGPLYHMGDYWNCVDHLHEKYCLTEVRIYSRNVSSHLWQRIQMWVLHYNETESFHRKLGSGRPHILTPNQDARLVAEVERNPFHTVVSMKATAQFPGHLQTIRNRESYRDRARFRRDVLNIGICVPRNCTATEVTADFKEFLEEAAMNLGIGVDVSMPEGGCTIQEDVPFHTAEYIAITVIFTLVVLLSAGTTFEVIRKKQKKPPKSLGGRLLLCFSVLTNWRRLTTLNESEEARSFRSIQGMRTISIYLVVFGHMLQSMFFRPLQNPEFLEQGFHDESRAGFMSGTVIMSAFFFIGGFVFTYFFLKQVDSQARLTGKDVMTTLLKRYLRLTPLSAVVILLTAAWQVRVGKGPLMATFTVQVCNDCRNYWWTNLLYINNYGYFHKCMVHTWYLAVDFQCYIVFLLILVPVWKYPRYAKMILFSALGVWILVTFLQTYIERLDPVLLSLPENMQHLPANKTYHRAYLTFQHNVGPYTVGVIFGYFHNHRNKQHKYSKKIRALLWSFVLTVPGAMMVIPYYFYQNGYEYNALIASTYACLNKVLFAAGIGIIVIGCATGHGRMVNSILSWRPLQILARLSFAVYLIHPFFIRAEAAQTTEPLHVNDYWSFFYVFAHMVYTTLAALFLCLLVELPASALVDLFKSGK